MFGLLWALKARGPGQHPLLEHAALSVSAASGTLVPVSVAGVTRLMLSPPGETGCHRTWRLPCSPPFPHRTWHTDVGAQGLEGNKLGRVLQGSPGCPALCDCAVEHSHAVRRLLSLLLWGQ